MAALSVLIYGHMVRLCQGIFVVLELSFWSGPLQYTDVFSG